MRRSTNWTLADVLDFEALVAADERADDPQAAARRDAGLWREKIAPDLTPGEDGERAVVFHRWLAARRAGEPLPGTWLAGGWRAFAAGAVFAGLVLGFAVAGGALYYAGARPVNVAVFLAMIVGVQWLFLAWTLVVTLSRGLRSASGRLLVRLGERLGQWLAGAGEHLTGEQRLRLRAETVALRRLAGRNLQLLRWPPWLALQGFGIAWNLGALAALLLRVFFTDVAFGWESTWAESAQGMHAAVRLVALPWTWFAPDACPTLDQVGHSWFHYQSGVAALARTATASWWPWLAGVILVYGLLPRALLWLWFWTRLRAALGRVSFDEPRHKAAWQRLTGPVIQGERAHRDNLPSSGTASFAAAPRRAEPGCVLIAAPLGGVRAEIERWVETQFGWRIACVETAEIDFPSGNEAAFARLAAALTGAPRWLIAVPAPFTAFTAFAQFVERLRALGPAVPPAGFFLVVALDGDGRAIAPTPGWAGYWRDFAQAEMPDCATFFLTL